MSERNDHLPAPRSEALPAVVEHQNDNGQSAPGHTGHTGHDEIPTDLPKLRNRNVVIATVIVALCFVGLFVLGWIPRHNRLGELEKDKLAVVSSKPQVQISSPKRSDKPISVILPADARAFQETNIYPRATGYLKKLNVDIGDTVQAGQTIAEIDAPDVEANLNQARAALAQAQAEQTKSKNDFDLSQATYQRYKSFSESGGVTQQQLEEKQSGFTQAQSTVAGAEANTKAAQANVERLAALQNFTKVIAPFGGTITTRNFDLGALMTADNASKEMFKIADTSVLRVFVNVPQAYISSLAIGQQASISVRNFPGAEFKGKIVRSAGALDPATRTLRYEIDLPNDRGVLFAGMYATARLTVNDTQPPMVVPTSALVFDASGTKVWVVKDGKAYPQQIGLGRDLGTETEVSTGLAGGEQVVTNPGERLREGGEVDFADGRSEGAPPKMPQAAKLAAPTTQQVSAR